MKRGFVLPLTLLVLSIFVLPLTAQEVPSAPTLELAEANSDSLPTLELTAYVLSSFGVPVTGLTADDFTIIGDLAEQAQIQSVEIVQGDDLAFATVLAMDTSSSMIGTPIEAAKAAALQFVQAADADDPIAIIVFANDAKLIQDFTTDHKMLEEAINSIEAYGVTALYDAAVLSIQTADMAPVTRRTVILLSDGADYGEVSENDESAALSEAAARGVAVNAIGLGFGADRGFLEELAQSTTGGFIESPSPNELADAYLAVAEVLRSQYALTLDVDVPLDGTIHTLVLQATTETGETNESEISFRAPIPIPLVSLPASLADDGPISEAIEIAPEIKADDEIARIEYLVDDELLGTGDVFIIDPVSLSPGSHILTVNVSDVDGDVGTATGDFEIAALSPELSIRGAFPTDPISDFLSVTLDTGGQTAIVQVSYAIDDAEATLLTTEPYSFEIDPGALAPGEHSVVVEAVNEGEQATIIEQDFTVSVIAPLVEIGGMDADAALEESTAVTVMATLQPGTRLANVTLSIDEEGIAEATNLGGFEATLDPMTLTPGAHDLTAEVTLEEGVTGRLVQAFEVAALAPTISISGLEADAVLSENMDVDIDVQSQTEVLSLEVSVDDSQIDEAQEAQLTITLDVAELEAGEHRLEIRATNASDLSNQLEIPFAVEANESEGEVIEDVAADS